MCAQAPTAAAVLQGARDIVAERIAERADIRQHLRQAFSRYGVIQARAKKKATAGVRTKYEDYYRLLALLPFRVP